MWPPELVNSAAAASAHGAPRPPSPGCPRGAGRPRGRGGREGTAVGAAAATQTSLPRPDGNDDEAAAKDVGSGGIRPSPARIRSSLEWIRHGGRRIWCGRSRIGDGLRRPTAASSFSTGSGAALRLGCRPGPPAAHYARAGMEAEQQGRARGGRATAEKIAKNGLKIALYANLPFQTLVS